MAGASVACRSALERTAVLTFDDAVRSQRLFVAPLLAELGFSATFFVTHRWMEDRENFMSWEEIAEIANMGFEIGNHSWSHANFSIFQPRQPSLCSTRHATKGRIGLHPSQEAPYFTQRFPKDGGFLASTR